MLKSFQELYALDISKHVQKKPTFKKENGKLIKLPEKYHLEYIEWATCLVLLYENGAKNVKIESVHNSNYPAAYNEEGINPFVTVMVTIDSNMYVQEYPVIKGNIASSKPNQLDIHNAQQRAFVKCVAINTGLGLKLWQKEETQLSESFTEGKKLPEIVPGTDKWDQAVKAIKDGYTLEMVQSKYYISEENIKKLNNEVQN